MSKRPSLRDCIFYAVTIAVILLCILGKHLSEKEKTGTGEENKIVAVHVKGQVKNPGYYELKPESRIKDAIKIAGGLTANADANSVNLAKKLTDGSEIIVYPKTGGTKDANAKVDINTADVFQLSELSGIGEGIASDIVEYRNKHGKFKSIKDIMKVTGISKKRFEAIADDICAE